MKPKKRRAYLQVRIEHWQRRVLRSSRPSEFQAANRKPGSVKK